MLDPTIYHHLSADMKCRRAKACAATERLLARCLRHSCSLVPTCPSRPTDQTHPASPRQRVAAARSARAARVPRAAAAGSSGAAAGPVALRGTGGAPRSARACARYSSGPCCPRRQQAPPGCPRLPRPLPCRHAQAMPCGVWSPRQRQRPAVTCGQRAQHAVP